MSYTRLESRPAITRLHGECDDFVVAMKKDGMSMTHVQLYQNATELQIEGDGCFDDVFLKNETVDDIVQRCEAWY